MKPEVVEGGGRFQVGLRHEEPASKRCCKLLLKPLGGKDSLKFPVRRSDLVSFGFR